MRTAVEVGFLVIGLSAFGLFFAGIAALALSLAHRQPDIPWSWILRTFLSRHNFTERGRRLRRAGWLLLLAGLVLLIAAKQYDRRILRPTVQPPAASLPTPA